MPQSPGSPPPDHCEASTRNWLGSTGPANRGADGDPGESLPPACTTVDPSTAPPPASVLPLPTVSPPETADTSSVAPAATSTTDPPPSVPVPVRRSVPPRTAVSPV